MKTSKSISMLFFCLASMICQAQPYFSNNTWTEYSINTLSNYISSKRQYWIANDTVINGKNYKKIVDKDRYIGAIREENGKVYARLDYGDYSYESDDFLLYDFTVQVGDTIKSTALEGALFSSDGITVRDIDEIELENGEKRKRFFFNETSEWIEGIGSVNGLFHDAMSHLTNYNVSYLVCFQQNDMPLYVNTEKCLDGKCCEDISDTKLHKPNSEKKTSIFPNPTKGTVNIVFPKDCISVKVIDNKSNVLQIISASDKGQLEVDLSKYSADVYYIIINFYNSSEFHKIIKH